MSDKPNQAEDSDKQVEIWKIKRVCVHANQMRLIIDAACGHGHMAICLQLIKALEAARGNGTSMISLIMPPKDQVQSMELVQPRQPSFHPIASNETTIGHSFALPYKWLCIRCVLRCMQDACGLAFALAHAWFCSRC